MGRMGFLAKNPKSVGHPKKSAEQKIFMQSVLATVRKVVKAKVNHTTCNTDRVANPRLHASEPYGVSRTNIKKEAEPSQPNEMKNTGLYVKGGSYKKPPRAPKDPGRKTTTPFRQ